jgi:hypothetical protein
VWCGEAYNAIATVLLHYYYKNQCTLPARAHLGVIVHQKMLYDFTVLRIVCFAYQSGSRKKRAPPAGVGVENFTVQETKELN